MARASILWLIGEYCEHVPKIAPDVLRKMAKSFTNEEDIVKLQIINLAAKLYLTNSKQVLYEWHEFVYRRHKPETHQLQQCLVWAPLCRIGSCQTSNFEWFVHYYWASLHLSINKLYIHTLDGCYSCLLINWSFFIQTKLLTQYVLNLAKYDQNYDIRDRARFIRQLIVPTEKSGALSKYAKKLFLALKPAPILESPFKGTAALKGPHLIRALLVISIFFLRLAWKLQHKVFAGDTNIITSRCL